jgi:hypothetical protein
LDGVDCHITDSNRGRRPTVTNNANNNANANTTQSLPGESPRQSPTPPPTVVQMQQHPPPQSRRQSSSEQVPSPHTDVPNDYLVSLTFESKLSAQSL